jgi:outer membrane protein assembly factor BamB
MIRYLGLSWCLGALVGARAVAQPSQDGLIGTWTGEMRYGGERQPLALRFAYNDKQKLHVFLSQPDMKFYDLPDGPVDQHGDDFSSPDFKFRLVPNGPRLAGTMAFDGNEVPFELVPGALPVRPAPKAADGPVAQPRWTFKTGDAIWSSPTVDRGVVYFGSNDSAIYALDAARGARKWRTTTGGWVMGQPTIDDAFLYALSDDGLLYKLDAHTGRIVWRFETHGGGVKRDMPRPNGPSYDYLTSGATVVEGTVFIGSADKRLYAVDAATGRERWHFETGDIIRSTPAVNHGTVYFGSRDHDVYAVDARTGALRWKYDTHREVVSSPLVVNGTVYIGSRSSNLFALDAATGTVRWKCFYWSSWVESSARIRDGVLYIGSSDYQQALAIDTASGRKLWTFDTDGSPWSTPAVTNRSVYIGAVGIPNLGYIEHHGGFFAIDRTTGKVQWRYPMNAIANAPTYGVASSPAVAAGLVYFGGLDGIFYAFPADGLHPHRDGGPH